MNNIILQNFRNIANTDPIELKPLTFLVGKNGAGKSSFLRLFPLLKQSVSEPKMGPLLWYAENGVDFGDFNTTVMKGESQIGIGFDIIVNNRLIDEAVVSLLMNIETDKSDDQYDHVSSLYISYKDVKINIIFNDNRAKVQVNDIDMGSHPFFMQSYGLFPNIFTVNRVEDKKLMKELTEVLPTKNTHTHRGPYEFMFMSLREFSDTMKDKDIKYDIKTLFSKIVCMNLDEMLSDIHMALNDEMRNLVYIGPFRNSPQRYYRLQNKSTRMIDMYGSNIAAFVKAMPREQLTELNARLKPKYGFELDYKSKFGQVSLFIKKDKKETNLIDNGYGYSQLMPILLAINAFNQRPLYPSTKTDFLCIEQPELHLHPKMQSLFGDTLANTTKQEDHDMVVHKCVIVETHSRQIIESVGRAIYEKEISSNDVAVYLFEQDEDNKASIRKTQFDKEGYLMNWPIGFLD